MTNDLAIIQPLPAALLQRRAIVYVRQSTQSQVMTNLEGQRRQYDLVETARTYGFKTIDVIDDDLGISASGYAERPGFERLIAALCTGGVGAVFCLEVSRLARNGRDWHHVLEICGMVEAPAVRALDRNESCPCPESGICRNVGGLSLKCTYHCEIEGVNAIECLPDNPTGRPGTNCDSSGAGGAGGAGGAYCGG